MRRLTLALTVAVFLVTASSAAAFDPVVEAQNFGKGNERSAIYNTPEYRLLLQQVSIQNTQAAAAMQAADPERNFAGHLCTTYGDGCAGDVRLYDWEPKGYGLVKKVLFTARSGATLSGRVWRTRAGPAKRPGIVITNGSVQAPETVYWFVAQTLAKAGYVVLTWDPQGQGQSDERGETPDENEGSPAQSDGRPFYDGTEDAINFFLSNPSHPYEPRKSCESGTSHAAKQDRRVKEGWDAAFNPYWQMIDTKRIGIAGHSFGAAGVSYIGQKDPRVKSIVAWDNLGVPDPAAGKLPVKPCPADPASHAPAPVTKPALGMSADYFIPPTPNTGDPDPLGKSEESLAYSKAGVDTGELIIRGGTHYDFDWIPNQGFPATLRGADMIAWYTNAWFDKYVKGDKTADSRLLTNRWRADAQEGAVDPHNDANMFSFYYRSRLAIGLSGGGRFTCEDMRPGCAGLRANDGQPADYSYLKIATSKDAASASSCRDRTAPTSRITSRRTSRARGSVSFAGHSRDKSCAGATRKVARVYLTVAKVRGRGTKRRCAFLQKNGRLTRFRSCSRIFRLRARGAASWRVTVKGRLPRGRYEATARGVDANNNYERPHKSGNRIYFTVR
jgi:dienelactone hydrolase